MSYAVPEHIKNANPLSTNDRFSFVLGRLTHVPFAIQSVTLPSISAQPTIIPTPHNKVPLPGNSGLEWGPLQIEFLVDEFMLNYKELYRWLVGINAPTSFQERIDYRTRERATRDIEHNVDVSDALLTITESNRQPILRFHFQDVFPTELGAITFVTTESGVNVAKTTVIFRYTAFTITDVMTPPSGA
jgi:hypothetical protein